MTKKKKEKKRTKNKQTKPHHTAEQLSCNTNQVPTFAGADKDQLWGEVVTSQ